MAASFAGSSGYSSTTSNNATFTVAQAIPTVTLSDAGGPYNGSPYSATPLVNGVGSLEGVTPR